MFINGIPFSQFGGRLKAEYTVSGAAVTTNYHKPRDGSSFVFLGSEIGLKTIALPFDLYGDSPMDAQKRLSAFRALCMAGKTELFLPDGFYYTSVLQSFGETRQITPCILSASCEFLGIQHEELTKTVCQGTFFVQGTLPKMDCTLSFSPSADAASYTVAGITFTNVKKGDQIVIDGMTKRVLINGAPAAQRCNIVEFPFLTPGENRIAAPDPVTVQYYPSYQ